MFYKCIEITEIDMTKFDTSLVTDMTEMFSSCSSLESLNVSNLNTERVETFEKMFYQCTSLTSLNLESFTNPSATSLSKMFYGCTNLEYINIKNFEEIENTTLDDMFYNIPKNAIVCLLSCPPPTNFTISYMNEANVTISWGGFEFNKFIISYALQSLLNPELGIKINVINNTNYTFTDLNPDKRYDIYIKTDCDTKSSYWIGPLLISIGSYNMIHNATNTTNSTNYITTCSKAIYDSGGPYGNYSNYANSTLIIYPETPDKFVSIKGKVDTESYWDYLYIYNGEGTKGKQFGRFEGNQNVPLIVSTIGSLTIKFRSDGSVIRAGFELFVDCAIISQSIYNLIIENNCRLVYCDSDYRRIQNIILPKSKICVKNCNSTNQKYHYKGQCYDDCPENTTNINFFCYSNITLEKCDNFSLESDYFGNICIKCKEYTYPKYSDSTNKYTYVNCYKNNSLEKYYLDYNDFYFKSCYKSCSSCNQKGTIESHNCILCDNNYKFNLTSGDYYNCYTECNNYYYFDRNKNYYCLNKKECPNNYINLIEEKNQCIDECYNDNEYKYSFRKKCYQNCPEEISYESEIKNNFCEVKCNKEMPFEIIEYQNCTNFCGIKEMSNKLCISKFKEMNSTNGNLILKNIIEEITSTNFNTTNIFSDNKNIIINESFITFILTNNQIQNYSENNIVELGNCENILKNYYNTEELLIFLIDIDKKDEDIKLTGFEIYSKNDENITQKLDLNLCKDVVVNNETLLDNNAIIKCSDYSIDSLLDNSCITCAQNYYFIYDEFLQNKAYIKCYKQIKGYYLYNNQYFKKCYESCELCETNGNITYHNCIKCKKTYFYELYISSSLNCYNRCDFNFYYDENNQIYYCTPDNNCVNYYDKMIPEKKQCVHDCKQYQDFPFELQKKCYNKCPANISEISKEREYYCEIKCPKDSPYELIEIQKCVKDCTLSQINSKKCKKNYISIDKNDENEVQEQLIENIKEEIINGLNTSGIDKGEDIIIQEKDIIITITNNENQKKEFNAKTNNTSIDLGKCSIKLKNYYNISENESLYILKMDIKQEGYKIPKIQYEVYYPLYNNSTLCLLNLSVCKNTDIDIYLPLTLDGSLDQYDPNSEFYNDICNTFTSEKGTDLTLSERKKNYINNNLAVCEENCNFEQYNDTIGKAICSCKTKTDFVNKISENAINKNDLLKNFADFNNIFNIKILKCVSLIFSIKSFNENYANIILIIIIALYFICFFLFIFKGYKDEIKFYIDIIAYFILFHDEIISIIQQMENNKKIKFELKRPKNNKRNINIYKIKNSKNISSKTSLNLKKKLPKKKSGISKFTAKKKVKLNTNTKKNKLKIMSDKTKLKVKANDNIMKNVNIFREFKKSSEKEIYKLYKKLYTKTDTELNELSYREALQYDKRNYFSHYFSLIKTNHLLFFSFLPRFDFNSRIIKMYLFFFNFATLFFVNALFFTDETMGKINVDGGYFNFIYNLPQILYSSIISSVINEIVKMFALTEINFILYRNGVKQQRIFKSSKRLKKIFKIKFSIFFNLDFILLGCFWIYLSCFCAVYHNTQIHLIKDTLISFGASLISPFAIYLLPGIFRIIALKSKRRRILYELYRILQFLLQI